MVKAPISLPSFNVSKGSTNIATISKEHRQEVSTLHYQDTIHRPTFFIAFNQVFLLFRVEVKLMKNHAKPILTVPCRETGIICIKLHLSTLPQKLVEQ